MVKKVLAVLGVLVVMVSGVIVLQVMGGELANKTKDGVVKKVKVEEKKNEVISKKSEIKFAGVDINKLKVAKVERLTYDADKIEYKSYMYPKWSPDGKMIAFTSAPGLYGAEFEQKFKYLWVMNADGSNKRKLTDEEGIGYNFEWTPDGKNIVYKVGNSIKEIEVETKKSYVVISAKKSISSIIKYPSGEIITVVDEDVMQINRTIKNERLKAAPSVKKSKKGLLLTEGGKNSKIIWSSFLGGKLICRANDYGNTHIGHIKSGMGIFPFTLSWSPNGSNVIYPMVYLAEDADTCPVISVEGKAMESDLYIGNTDGSNQKRLTNTKSEAELYPNWSPDGEKILYVSGKNGDIYVIRQESGSDLEN